MSGMPVKRAKFAAYVLSGVFAAIAGLFLTFFTYSGEASAANGNTYTLYSIAAVVLGGVSLFGGRGSAVGAIFGALLIYITWMISDPVAQWLFNLISSWSTDIGWGAIPEIQSRASQMSVFVFGVLISIALSYAAKGCIP